MMTRNRRSTNWRRSSTAASIVRRPRATARALSRKSSSRSSTRLNPFLMASYRLTPDAENDLLGIAEYTVETWGVKQARRYEAALLRCFAALGQGSARTSTPLTRRPELKSCRCMIFLSPFRRRNSPWSATEQKGAGPKFRRCPSISRLLAKSPSVLARKLRAKGEDRNWPKIVGRRRRHPTDRTTLPSQTSRWCCRLRCAMSPDRVMLQGGSPAHWILLLTNRSTKR